VPLIPLALALLLVLALPLLLPLALVQRYRLGKARRPGRRWVARINLVMMAISSALFLWLSAVTTFWIPEAFRYSCIGMIGGAFLGLLGLALTRWEMTHTAVHYTPNRWLVLVITLAVTMRIVYGFWRTWHAWISRARGSSWLASAGMAGSLAVGALVLGYYLTYSAGISWRLRRHSKKGA